MDDHQLLGPTADDHDPDLDEDDSMFHPGQEPHLAEDGASPAAPATDVPGRHLPPDHPAFDSADDMQPEEVYEEGATNASGVGPTEEDSNISERLIVEDDEDRFGRAR